MTPMLRVLFRASRLLVLSAVLLAGCDGGGGSPAPEPAEPQFDLTGHWRMGEPVDCEVSNLEGPNSCPTRWAMTSSRANSNPISRR